MSFRDPVGPLRERARELERRVQNHPPKRERPARVLGCGIALAIPIALAAATWGISELPYFPGSDTVAYTLLGLTMFMACIGPWIALVPTARTPSRRRWKALQRARVEIGAKDEEAQLRARVHALEAYIEEQRPRRAEEG